MDKIDEFLEDVDFGVHAFELITEILKNKPVESEESEGMRTFL